MRWKQNMIALSERDSCNRVQKHLSSKIYVNAILALLIPGTNNVNILLALSESFRD